MVPGVTGNFLLKHPVSKIQRNSVHHFLRLQKSRKLWLTEWRTLATIRNNLSISPPESSNCLTLSLLASIVLERRTPTLTKVVRPLISPFHHKYKLNRQCVHFSSRKKYIIWLLPCCPSFLPILPQYFSTKYCNDNWFILIIEHHRTLIDFFFTWIYTKEGLWYYRWTWARTSKS